MLSTAVLKEESPVVPLSSSGLLGWCCPASSKSAPTLFSLSAGTAAPSAEPSAWKRKLKPKKKK